MIYSTMSPYYRQYLSTSKIKTVKKATEKDAQIVEAKRDDKADPASEKKS